MARTKNITLVYVVLAIFALTAMATMEEDEKDCAEQLANLAACIPYVSGTAKKPTPECCDDTKKVRSAKPKCLCVLIKESTDPSLGLPINTSLALQMPSACNIDAKVSDCPAILNLPPGSPDAKIFKGASVDSATQTSPSASSTTSPSASSSSSSSTTPESKTASTASNGDRFGQNLFLLMASALVASAFHFS